MRGSHKEPDNPVRFLVLRATGLRLRRKPTKVRRDMSEIPDTQIETFIRNKLRPLVGFSGDRNFISWQHDADRLVCRLSKRTYVRILLLTATFGPVFAAVLYFRPKQLNPAPDVPAVIFVPVVGLALISAAILLRYSLGSPRIEAFYSTGDLQYFKYRGSRPVLIVHRNDVQNIEVESRIFLDEGTRVQNYCIRLTTREGREYALCVSSDEQLIRSLHRELENLLRGQLG
jgi:hypothetical protein